MLSDDRMCTSAEGISVYAHPGLQDRTLEVFKYIRVLEL